ncbi:MAG: hypothetical protein IT364_24550 [Candidatus Hydrogenedentes bacterium]|nr:hypothetical protein [Candidatus Hydrogenedentota bacterium]
MAIPTSYTEATFAAYLHSELGPVASSLAWTVDAGDYDEAVNDALLMYGVTDIAGITGAENIQKLRLLGKLAAWRRVLEHTAGDHDFSADGASYSRSQVNQMAQERVQDLETRAAPYLDEYSISVQRMDHPNNPYGSTELEDREL